MIEVGRLCVKIAGRDAGRVCVVVDVLDDSFVLIDGQTRRRKCNIKHLEPLKTKVDLKKGASREEVFKVLKKHNIECRETKPKKVGKRPVRVRKKKPAHKKA